MHANDTDLLERCTHGYNNGTMITGQPTAFCVNLRPASQKGFHAWYCIPHQKPMTAEIIGHRGKGDLSLLFYQTVILSNCILNAMSLLMSWCYSQFGQVSFFWQGVVASAETPNWSKHQTEITRSVQLWVAHLSAAHHPRLREEGRAETIEELADREESCDVLIFGQGMVADASTLGNSGYLQKIYTRSSQSEWLMAETTRPRPY